ncbi:MAG: polysaccharide deacetylase family protein [Candidatus Woesearchaeota archaeon]
MLGISIQPKKAVHIIKETAQIPLKILRTGRLVLESRKQEAGILRFNPHAKNNIALTFDDGPTPSFTPEILDILKEHEAKATFFLTGKNVQRYPDICRRIVREGHELGNHTYSHFALTSVIPLTIRREIELCELAILKATGRRTKYFRPPYGLYNRFVKKAVLESNYKMVMWSLRTYDSSYGLMRKKMIEGLVLRKIKPGDIILMHDSKSYIKNIMDNKATLKALPEILEYIQMMGLKPVTISELFQNKG